MRGKIALILIIVGFVCALFVGRRIGFNTSAQVAQVPLSYKAADDRVARSEPALAALGPAGSIVVDPSFGTRILRVTDARTRPDKLNRAYRTPSSPEQNSWNADGTIFYVEDGGGFVLPYSFNPATMTAARLGDTSSASGGLLLQLRISPAFSFTDRNLIYGIAFASATNNGRTITEYNFQTEAYTSLLNLDTLVAGLSGTTGDVSVSANEKICTYFGGASQNKHYLIVVWDKSANQSILLDTLNSTVDGQPASMPLGWHIHNARIDKSGRYVVITRVEGNVYVFDTETKNIVEMTAWAGGHKAAGFGHMVNKDGAIGPQWARRALNSSGINAPVELINPSLAPTIHDIHGHLSWNNAVSTALAPAFGSTFRAPRITSEWRAWDDEIIAIRTDGVESAVWRFAHHRSNVDNGSGGISFWDTPRGNVSQDGRFFMFTSNWERTVGTNRQDVFIVELADNIAPVISEVAASSVNHSRFDVTWATDELADSQVEYGATTAYGSTTPLDANLVSSHRVTLTGLTPGAVYHYRVKSMDSAGNLAMSGDFTFTVPADDTTPPIISGVASSSITTSAATVAWATDEAADSQVEYGTTTAYGSSSNLDAALVTSHSVRLSALAAGTLYNYRVKSRDSAGNLRVSGNFTFRTAYNVAPVVWTNIINCTATGSSLQKSSGRTDSTDAGATSTQQILSGDGYVEFRASERNTDRWCGLSNGNSNTTPSDIDFSIKLGRTGFASVRERDVFKKDITYTTGDVFRVAVEGGAVKYYKNGVLFYTSAAAPVYPLLVDASLLTLNATLTDVTIGGGDLSSASLFDAAPLRLATSEQVFARSFSLTKLRGVATKNQYFFENLN